MLFCFFDTDQTLLSVFTHSYLENPNAQVEPMRCPTNASWEADMWFLANELLMKRRTKNAQRH
jgi:hypothetical protein